VLQIRVNFVVVLILHVILFHVLIVFVLPHLNLKQIERKLLIQQIALIYTGINGYLDDLEVSDVKKYCASLITYLSTSQKPFTEIVRTTNQFTDEAETSLQEAIAESKEAYMKTK